MSIWENNKEIEIFQEYLRTPTVQPNVNYEPCVTFLKNQAATLGLPISIYYPSHPKKPVVVIKWTGTEPEQPSIMLNSHMDVVPAYEEFWTHPPFGAEIDSEGKIFCRGAQDMKCVAMQYLGAIRALLQEGVTLKRTLYVTYVPDEEIDGPDGMQNFVKSQEFKSLNVGFVLDEGITSPNDVYSVFYAEKTVWRIHFNCSGTSGHGSVLHKNTAGEKIRHIIDKFMDFREHEVMRLENNSNFTSGDVTSVNLTLLSGGIQTNVVPPLLTVVFDVRLAIDVNHTEFEEMLKQWCEEAGGNIEIFFEIKKPKVPSTKVDSSNVFWVALESALVVEMKLKIKTLVRPGRSDSCFIRPIGIPAIGFSPMIDTPQLNHGHNEYIKADTYLKGIDIYKQILLKVANA